ncbi:MAG: NUDIX domain-containing protein [Streptococcaceae bacterium]|jgi:8-oxo-dGTP diphosphatase|nr:NUDIX domain-containing protein [Streptococcaceae bacterium]
MNTAKKGHVFGEQMAGVDYQTRTGAHGVVTRGESDLLEVCLLQTPNGAYYLPGGEIEPGESQEEALRRELIEEIGASEIILGSYLGEAADYYYSKHRDAHFYNPIHAYVVQVTAWAEPTEKGNKVCWFMLGEAISKVKRQSHKWALEEFQKLKG